MPFIGLIDYSRNGRCVGLSRCAGAYHASGRAKHAQTKVADIHVRQSKVEQARQGPHGRDPQRLVVLLCWRLPSTP